MRFNPYNIPPVYRDKPTKVRLAWQGHTHALLCDMIRQLGGVVSGDSSYRYQLDTPVGPLSLAVERDCGVVFGRFADPPRAANLSGCNPHTGKFNLFFRERRQIKFAGDSAADRCVTLRTWLQRVLDLRVDASPPAIG